MKHLLIALLTIASFHAEARVRTNLKIARGPVAGMDVSLSGLQENLNRLCFVSDARVAVRALRSVDLTGWNSKVVSIHFNKSENVIEVGLRSVSGESDSDRVLEIPSCEE